MIAEPVKTPHARRSPLFFILLFSAGAVGYFCLELLFRGFSHWTMAICGGICLCSIYLINRRLNSRSLFLRALCGSLLITAVEFAAGCLLNLCWHWDIWDYSNLPMNILGQISAVFSVLWFLLCIPVCIACSFLDAVALRRTHRSNAV